MNKNLKTDLLSVVEKNLPSLSVETIKGLISDNERMASELENLTAQKKIVDKQFESARLLITELEGKVRTDIELKSREEVVTKKETKLEVAALSYQLEAEKSKTSSLHGLVSTLFQNKNISHFVNMNGTAYMPDGRSLSVDLHGNKDEM